MSEETKKPAEEQTKKAEYILSLIHISEPTRH